MRRLILVACIIITALLFDLIFVMRRGLGRSRTATPTDYCQTQGS